MQSNGVTVLSNGKALPNGNQISNGCPTPKTHSVEKNKQQLSVLDRETIRIIGQHLREMGFHETLEHLIEESGCSLDHQKAAGFRRCVVSGNWTKANEALIELSPLLDDPCVVERMRLLLYKEKYLELLEGGKVVEALHCLRHELAPLPLHHSDKHLQLLTSYMMYSKKEDLHKAANWPGVLGGSRERLMEQLQAFLPPSIMLPPRRLKILLAQAVQLQVDRCPFHYFERDLSSYSLLADHICTRNQFPSETVHVLSDHSDEVWFVSFSHDGSRLASGSISGQIIIWNMRDQPTKELVIKAQNDGIACLAWSPDDSTLLSCGREDCPEAIAFNTTTGEVKCHVHNSSEDSLTCCAWNHTGEKFFLGGTRGQFMECSLDGSVTANWEGIRVHSIATHPGSDLVYAADTHNRIRQYNFSEKSSTTLVQEDHPIMSFSLSRNGQHALLNVATQSIHVWNLQDRCLVYRYLGVTQGHYTIHSRYGGINDHFIASGSEDHNVFIWHHKRETPVVVLEGHSRAVSCVAWNPKDHSMLASASDDGSIRIWGTEEQMRRQQEYKRERARAQEEKEERMGSPAVGEEGSSSREEAGGALAQQQQQQEGEGTEESDAQSSEMGSELERAEGSSSSLSSSGRAEELGGGGEGEEGEGEGEGEEHPPAQAEGAPPLHETSLSTDASNGRQADHPSSSSSSSLSSSAVHSSGSRPQEQQQSEESERHHQTSSSISTVV